MSVPIDANNCIEKVWEDQQTWIPVPLAPGDVLVFGSFLAHRSGPKYVARPARCTLMTADDSSFHRSNSDRPRAAIYATYNALSDGGDKHDAYYADRREHWPPTSERKEGKDYGLGALRYGFGSPMDGAQKHSRMIMGRKSEAQKA